MFRWIRALGSLRLSVLLLVLLCGVLIAGTVVEKLRGSEAAREAVYGAPWFAALLFLLAANVLCNLLVRFPQGWRWNYTLTHGGILLLLLGSLLTYWKGIEAQMPIFEGRAERTMFLDGSRTQELGFQVYLHKFHRRLEPGGAASHYASVVDFLDLSSPPRKLRENVTITLNVPVDFFDPLTKREYRFFQSSFAGPWFPGDEEYERWAKEDRGHLYLSRFGVNYDPGRKLKYSGGLLIVLGMAIGYIRATKSKKNAALLLLTLLLFLPGCRATLEEPLDWSAWRRMPVLGRSRVEPLDCFARDAVRTICGDDSPTLILPNGRQQKFSAAELLFCWLVEPEEWESVRFIYAGKDLRHVVLKLPPESTTGQKLEYVSPAEVEDNAELICCWAELRRRAEVEGENFRLTPADRKIKALVDVYSLYRRLTFDAEKPKDTPRRFYSRLLAAGTAWRKLAAEAEAVKRIADDPQVRELMIRCGESLGKVLGILHDGDFLRSQLELPTATLALHSVQLAEILTTGSNRRTTYWAAELRRQAGELHVALYDNGDTLRLVPALSLAALEENRAADEDAPAWLCFQGLIHGSENLLGAYPQQEVKAIRKAYAELKLIWKDRQTPDRPVHFAAAMERFATAVRELGEKLGPIRSALPLQHRDDNLQAVTAYPSSSVIEAELFYHRFAPFSWSWPLSLTATIFLMLTWGRLEKCTFWLGLIVLLAAQGLILLGLGLRMYLTGLIPLTGMFETVVFVAFCVITLGTWLTFLPLWRWIAGGWLERSRDAFSSAISQMLGRRVFLTSSAVVAAGAVLLACYAPEVVMRRELGSAPPILRDNFWLMVHVATIIFGYAAAAMALILADVALWHYLFGRYWKETIEVSPEIPDRETQHYLPPPACSLLAAHIYTLIKPTVWLLAAGTFLGAWWADVAWGRFWGWDPKEVWALVSLLAYLAVLHARHVGWAGEFALVFAAVLGATVILFNWYGVNFLLGGLHSYGAGASRSWPVLAAVALQWFFLVAAAGRYLYETAR